MYRYLPLIFLLSLFAFTARAQQPDTTKRSVILKSAKDTLISTRHDTVVARSFKPKVSKSKIIYPDSTHDPHKAVIRSLIIPGWGQLYNHQWYFVPAIYAGIGLLGWAVVFNNTYYNEFYALSIYRKQAQTPPVGSKYYKDFIAYQSQPDQAIYDATDSYRRDRDLSILGILGAWGINVVQAYIEAKFQHSYSVDNNLSIKINPGFINQPVFAQNLSGSYIPGIKITFTF